MSSTSKKGKEQIESATPSPSKDEKKAIKKLRNLCLKTVKLNVDMQMEYYKIRKAFENKYSEINDRRFQLLQSIRMNDDDDDQVAGLKVFWLKVLKQAFDKQINDWDEQVLTHVIDIRYAFQFDEVVNFVVEFIFEPNDFLSNTILKKTYFINTMPDDNDPLSFTCAEMNYCEGCKIDWKGDAIEDNKQKGCFFEFFSPPELPQDSEGPEYDRIYNLLRNDFNRGFYFKEWVIPKAVLFYTGELTAKSFEDYNK